MKRIDFNQNWVFNGKQISLPHDAMLYAERSAGSPSGTGEAFYEGGTYHYEKTFDVPCSWDQKTVRLEFEGVYRNALVRINGSTAGTNAYGYTGFTVDCTPYLKIGEANLVTVDADNTGQPNSRWYAGGGIYRPIWLYVADKAHIESVKIRTLSIDPPAVEIVTQVTSAAQELPVHAEILDQGTVMAAGDGIQVRIELPDAVLWDEHHPRIYTCRVTCGSDCTEEPFGIRQISWDAHGFYVNGQSVKLKGGCLHHDNGVLGACAYDEADDRRIRIMKEAGYNAVRSSHNPCSESLLRACDRHGMYLIDEMWDMWYERKNRYDYALQFMDHYADDVRTTLARDYNHPSVVMYSVGNENLEPYDEKGLGLLQNLIDLCHAQDPSRPVTMGLNPSIVHGAKSGKGLLRDAGDDGKQKAGGSMLFNILFSMFHGIMEKMAGSDSVGETIYPIIEKLDIVGYNYAQQRYIRDHEQYPEKLFYGSETMPYQIAGNRKLMIENDFVIGDFCWTAWDYLGEVGIGSWSTRPQAAGFNKQYPWKLAEAGAIDLIGNIGAEAAYSAALWDERRPACIMVTPPVGQKERLHKSYWRGTNAIASWSFSGHDGDKCSVEVIGHGVKAALYINRKKMGEKPLKDAKAVFKTTYQNGVIEAHILDGDGNVTERVGLRSAAGTPALRITPEPIQEGENLLFVHINVVGENDIVECCADRLVEVQVEGGELLGYGSADPCTEEEFINGRYPTYQGRSLAVIRPGSSQIMIRAGDICDVIRLQ